MGQEPNGADLLDVPAAVVCAFCGDAECPGCAPGDPSRSGVVSLVAWERTHTPMLSRLWATARSSTRDTETFFELLPDGPLMPALRFAATCELLASAAVFASLLAISAVVAPEWLKHVALDPAAREAAIRGTVVGLPAFAGLLVVAHAAHGLSIDLGAARRGTPSARTRALRFGLYACGWDLVMGPLGAVIVAVKEGVSASLGMPRALAGLPGRATRAFLRGCYQLEGEAARRALTTAYIGAALATLVFAILVLTAAIAWLLA